MILSQTSLYLTFTLLLLTSTYSAVTINQITGVTANNLMYTGTIGVGTQKLFYTFYGMDGETSQDNLQQKSLYIGIGCPGRSSQYMNVAGLGPKLLQNDLTLVDNSNRITKYANVMFIDSLGSGYSFASNPQTLPKTGNQYGSILTKAINSFISQTNLGKSKNLYIIGQTTFVRTLPGLDDIATLQGIVHIGGWFDFYGIGKYYGTGGIEQKIFTDSQRITIQATFVNCYNMQRSSKWTQAHSCYDTTLNYIESKTKNRNLYNIQLQSNLTQFLPMVQYYFSQNSVINTIKAPNTYLFETQSAQVQTNLYEDLAKNVDTQISQYLKDYLSIKQIFITGDYDFITYRKATRNWLENTLTFVDSAKFKPLNLTEYLVNGKVAAYKKSVPQIAYFQLVNSGHFAYNDQADCVVSILKDLLPTGESIEQGEGANLRGGNNQHVRHDHNVQEFGYEKINLQQE